MDDEQRPSIFPTQPSDEQTEPARRYAATRVRPRVEFGRREQPQQPPLSEESSIPDVIDQDAGGNGPGGQGGTGLPFGTGDMLGGREFAGGRMRVYGCSPGCLVMSLVVSIILTLLLNVIF